MWLGRFCSIEKRNDSSSMGIKTSVRGMGIIYALTVAFLSSESAHARDHFFTATKFDRIVDEIRWIML